MLSGKGIWIWNVLNCERGNYAAIADLACAADLSHLLVKIADAARPFNVTAFKEDLVAPLAKALRAVGIQVWGWHYVYGVDPEGEARQAIARMKQLGLDGYVIDAEGEFKAPGKAKAAARFLSNLRAGLPKGIPVALSSYRFPEFHPEFPWKPFLDSVDLVMPQVYWEQSHNPAEQLRRSVTELRALNPHLPIVPTGAAYKRGVWAASPGDVRAFLDQAKALDLAGANFWSWDNARANLPAVFDAVAGYDWPGPTTPHPDVPAPPPVLELPPLPWPATVVVPTVNVRSGPGVHYTDLGDLLKGARPLVQDLHLVGDDLWARTGDNTFMAMRYQGKQYLEWVP
jgi:hypothetical protein